MSAGLLQMRFHFGERDRDGGGPLEPAVIEACARRGVRAAALMRGVEGYGAKQRRRTDRLLSLSEDAPLVAVAVGEAAAVEALAEEVRAIAAEGLIVLEEVGELGTGPEGAGWGAGGAPASGGPGHGDGDGHGGREAENSAGDAANEARGAPGTVSAVPGDEARTRAPKTRAPRGKACAPEGARGAEGVRGAADAQGTGHARGPEDARGAADAQGTGHARGPEDARGPADARGPGNAPGAEDARGPESARGAEDARGPAGSREASAVRGPEDPGGAAGARTDLVKATVWGPRTGPTAPHVEAVAALRRHGAEAATVLLAVDGVLDGERRRARFLAGNRGVPAMTVAVGERAAVAAALAEVDGTTHHVTLEPVEPYYDYNRVSLHTDAAAARVTLVTSEVAARGAHPVYLDLIHQLRRAGARGATALRGVWGFRGDGEPHGDRVLALRRDVPLLVEVVDVPERAVRWRDLALSLAAADDVVHVQPIRTAIALE